MHVQNADPRLGGAVLYRRWDGMVERMVLYADDERTTVVEVREHFTRRKDKLRERRVYPQKVRKAAAEGEGGAAVYPPACRWGAGGGGVQAAGGSVQHALVSEPAPAVLQARARWPPPLHI